ncbi:hypothetical protein ACM7Q1_20465 [Paenibacillus illinoisensis]|uniref:hypothetical protein n=1 Tax=Paenibacillus illinoisensis TaxID=59845 RepID=UPI003A4D2AC4
MAFDLVARLKVKDEMSGKLRKVQTQLDATKRSSDNYRDSLGRLHGPNGRFIKETEKAEKALGGLGSSLKEIRGGFSTVGAGALRMSNSIGLLAAGYFSAQAAASAFNKTIGAAAQYEMREVTLSAMFGSESKKNVNSFLGYLESRADVSQYSMDDFLDVGKSFVPTTKDLRQLERATNLAERLGAIDPEQGITGAAYALKEFFSGDAVSLVERFELPRSELNKIKNLPLKDQLDQLDKFLNKLGATNELIDAQSKTTMGQWRTAIGGVNRAFREMGTDALTSIKPMLAEFNNWLKGPQFSALKSWGVDAFSGLVEGAVNAVRNATSYVQKNFINNPAFNQLPTFESKVAFVFDSIGNSFNKWWSAGGKAQTTKVTSDLIGFLVDGLEGSIKPLTSVATKVGRGIADGVMQGIKDHLNVVALLNPAKQQMEEFNNQYNSTKKLKEELDTWSKENPGKPMVEGGTIGAPAKSESLWDKATNALGFSGGLDRVPYNNYPTRLHQDEMVLTSQEARDYRNSNGGGNSAPNITIHATIREEADIDKLARKLAFQLAM